MFPTAREQEAAIQQGGLNVTSTSMRITPLAVLPCLLPLMLLCIPHILLNLSVSHSCVPLLASIGLWASTTQAYRLPVLHGLYVSIPILLLTKGTKISLYSLKIPILKSLGKKIAALSFPSTALFHVSPISRSSKASHINFYLSLLVLIFTLNAFDVFFFDGYFQFSCFIHVTTIFLRISRSHVSHFLLCHPILVFELSRSMSLPLSFSHSFSHYLTFPCSPSFTILLSLSRLLHGHEIFLTLSHFLTLSRYLTLSLILSAPLPTSLWLL